MSCVDTFINKKLLQIQIIIIGSQISQIVRACEKHITDMQAHSHVYKSSAWSNLNMFCDSLILQF